MVCMAISFGFALVVGGVYLTWWNEAELVCQSGAYDAAAAVTKDLGTCSIDSDLFNEFVHLTCPVESSLETSESSTGITAIGAYQLTLATEQYGFEQTSEREKTGRITCDKNNKNCRDEYRNCKCLTEKWTTKPVTESDFNSILFCDKCPRTTYSSKVPPSDAVWGTTPTSKLGIVDTFADFVPLGDGTLRLDSDDIKSIRSPQEIVTPTTPATISSVNNFELVGNELCGGSGDKMTCYKSLTKRINNGNVTSSDINVNVVGDLRLIVTAFGSTTISAVGKQESNSDGTASIRAEEFGESSLPPCNDRNIFYASDGSKSSSEIYQELHDGLRVRTTILRIVSFVMIFGGFYSIFSPIEDGAEMIPCIGEFLGAVVGFILYIVCALLALSLWFTVFAIAWIFYRPVYGAIFLAIAAVFTSVAVYLGRRQVQNKRSRGIDTYPDEYDKEYA